MTVKTREEVIRTAGAPKEEDRFTVVLNAHYLEWDTGNTHSTKWAYDRLIPTGQGPIQMDVRVNPGKKTELTFPGYEDGKFEILVAHKLPELRLDPEDLLSKQQRANELEVYVGDKLVTILKPDRMIFGLSRGPIFVQPTRSTSIAVLTAYPQ